MKIEVRRFEYNNQCTIGRMYIDGEYFGYTLEDVERSVKVKHETAICRGIYKCTITYSPRFRRHIVLINDVPQFSRILVHGGNTKKNTSGCVLVAANKISDTRIQGTLEKKFTAAVKAAIDRGEEVTIDIFKSDKYF